MRKTYEPVTESDIRNYEVENGVRFPDQYRSFLLRNNGGYAINSYFRIPEYENNIIVVHHIYGIGDMQSNLAEVNEDLGELLPAGFFIWASDPGGNGFLVGLNGSKHEDQIYYWLHDADPDEDVTHYFLSNSFDEFIDGLFSDKVN
jgi:hypothetical protein